MKSSKNHKSSRSQSSASTTNANASNTTRSPSKPLTPIRRFFFKLELLGPSPSVPNFLGKRRRDELPDHEAGFQHLHAYDHGANVEKVLDSRQVGEDTAIATSTDVYAQDGTRKWTKKPAGPRFHKKASTTGPSPLYAATESGSQSPTTPRPVPHSTRRDRSARIALQNIDTFLGEDAVIITALDSIPFNCHEELLSMSRDELVNVALDLNSKLPQALSIDTSEDRPLTFIRNAIEVLVGIRPEVPAAPLRVGKMRIPVGSDRPQFLEEFSFERRLENSSPLTTPLMNRTRRDGDGVSDLNNILRLRPQRLETLEEAEVEEESVHQQSFWRKRRRLSDENEDPDIVMRSDSDRSQPPPMLREPIDGFLPPPSPSPPRSPPRRVLRSHSRRLRSDTQGNDHFSTALASAMLESGYEARARRRRRANNNGKGNVKCNRQASLKSTASSTTSENHRNSILFPTIQSSCVISNMQRQESSEFNQGNTLTGSSDAIVSIASSRLAKSSCQSLQSTQSEQSTLSSESESPFLSIRSAYSSVSKMSICTRSTRRRFATGSSEYSGDSSATSKGDLEGSMDVSL